MPRRKLSEVISYNEFFILNSNLNIVTKKMTHNNSIGMNLINHSLSLYKI